MLRDTLIKGIASGAFTWKGPWVDGTAYITNDLVENNGSTYIATADHISSPATEPGDGVSWETVWDLVAAKGEDGSPGPPGQDGIFDRCDQLILEMEMEFKISFLCNYKVFTYTQKNLTDVDTYTDSTANVKLFHKDFIYNPQKQLIQTDLTRISDAAVLTSIFTYNNSNNLISIERSGYCSCSSSSSSSYSSSSSSL
jgi:hypothetical protein